MTMRPRSSDFVTRIMQVNSRPLHLHVAIQWTGTWKQACTSLSRAEHMVCVVTRNIFRTLVLSLLSAGFCLAQPLTPDEAIDRYLGGFRERQPASSELVCAVQIDTSIPNLKKQGSMSGLKVVSRAGQTVYRDLQFTGDRLIKTSVIARFLTNDVKRSEKAAGTDLTRLNYSIVYDRTSEYNGLSAYVFRLKPKRKRVGLFRGELWLDAATGDPLRLWGDLVKSPSFFVRNIRFVQDNQRIGTYFEPLRLLLTADTRIAGRVEMAVWLHPLDVQSTESTAMCGSGQR